MGEVAEMILDGTLCQECGGLMEDHDVPGYPRTCNACKRESAHELIQKSTLKVKCPTCGKSVKQAGLMDHQRDVHKASPLQGIHTEET